MEATGISEDADGNMVIGPHRWAHLLKMVSANDFHFKRCMAEEADLTQQVKQYRSENAALVLKVTRLEAAVGELQEMVDKSRVAYKKIADQIKELMPVKMSETIGTK
jgi:predicted nuclease with TOPRIM domain